MSFREQGYRFLVDTNGGIGRLFFHWIHPAEVANRIEDGWIDCTDMNDAEYDAFIDSLEK